MSYNRENIEKSMNPSKVFRKIFREKAHPEKEINEAIHSLRLLQCENHANLSGHFIIINKKIDKLTEKVDVILDIKDLKEKIDKL